MAPSVDLRFNAFLDTVVEAINSWLPELASCETHPGQFDLNELKRFATQSPAIRVATLGVGSTQAVSSGQRDCTLLMAAYAVTKDKSDLPRHLSMLNLIESLMDRICDHHFGVRYAAEATQVRAQNLYSRQIAEAGINLWAVSWSRKLRIGVPCDEAGNKPVLPVPKALYVSCVPEVGAASIERYMPVEGLPDGL